MLMLKKDYDGYFRSVVALGKPCVIVCNCESDIDRLFQSGFPSSLGKYHSVVLSSPLLQTYIGHILLLVNPNKELPIYSNLVRSCINKTTLHE